MTKSTLAMFAATSLSLSLMTGCGSGGAAGSDGATADDAAASGQTTVLSLVELDCSGCGEDLARALIKIDGIHKTAFDKRLAELKVIADPSVDVFAVAKANKPEDEGWHLALGAGKGTYLPWKEPPSGADVKELAKNGEDVPELEPHLVLGKITIVDFSAKWCEPCRELDEHVLELIEKRDDVAYRKLDVGDWDTPLGERYLKGVDALPYVLVYDKAGKKVDSIVGLDLARVDQAIAKAAEGGAAGPAGEAAKGAP
jgi:thiol-disulfide isomerase/thioredoxin